MFGFTSSLAQLIRFAALGLHPNFLIRLLEQSFNIMFGHAIGRLIGIVSDGNFGFIELAGEIFPGVVEVDLLEGVHQLVDGFVLARGMGIIIRLHNDQNIYQLYCNYIALSLGDLTSFQPYKSGVNAQARGK